MTCYDLLLHVRHMQFYLSLQLPVVYRFGQISVHVNSYSASFFPIDDIWMRLNCTEFVPIDLEILPSLQQCIPRNAAHATCDGETDCHLFWGCILNSVIYSSSLENLGFKPWYARKSRAVLYCVILSSQFCCHMSREHHSYSWTRTWRSEYMHLDSTMVFTFMWESMKQIQ